MYPYITYLVCATPRSGSTLLCEALTLQEIFMVAYSDLQVG